MKEINEAYDTINKMRSQRNTGASQASRGHAELIHIRAGAIRIISASLIFLR